MTHHDQTGPVQPALHASFALGGEMKRRLDAVTTQWLLPTPLSNPKILEMFRFRDRQPAQSQMPWAGEFAGKYLTSAVEVYRLTRAPRLRAHLEWFVAEIISLQDDEGYLGPWPRLFRLAAYAPNCEGGPWDAWGHYHIMYGLLLWHADQSDEAALACCMKMADYLCRRFLNNPQETLHGTGSQEMNQAVIHSLCLLYERTGVARYRALAHQIEREFESPPAGDYIRTALRGVPFYAGPKPRWESLHPIMALPELFYITGDSKYRDAFEHLWWTMLEGDRHNTGGFSAGERATGDPYDGGAIETCCTVAWMAMSTEMLRLTGNSVVADELELSLLNSGLGMMSPSGRWVTYNTPMRGSRHASATEIGFQARAGSSELNCCSVNGPRALGLLSSWAVMRRGDGVVLNFYGPGRLSAPLPSGDMLELRQSTRYPHDGNIRIAVGLSRAERFPLFLRIPAWSERTRVSVNGVSVGPVTSGAYLEIEREWRTGDRIAIVLDFRAHFWIHPTASAGPSWLASIYRGPILLAYDPTYDQRDTVDFPVLNAARLDLKPVSTPLWLKPLALYEAATMDGGVVRVCDFASAGVAGMAYETWLPVEITGPVAEFSQTRPLRTRFADPPPGGRP